MSDKLTPNPNTNCLAMMRCPACGSFGPFLIDAHVTVLVSDDGTEDQGGDYEWDSRARCECNACHHVGTVTSFTDEAPEPEPKFMVFNFTDGVYVSPEAFTKEQAEQIILDFRARFHIQGYYKTADGDRISVEDVEFRLEPVTSSERTDTFKTDDGYTLRWSNENLSWFTGKTWEDRDMEFPANGDGLPLDHMGEPLDGCYIKEE